MNLNASCNCLHALPHGDLLARMSALLSLNLENNSLTTLDAALGGLPVRLLLCRLYYISALTHCKSGVSSYARF